MDEGRLLERCRKGDAAAWEELVRRYWGFAFRIAYRLLRQREEAEDAAQDAFLRLYQTLDSFRGQAQFRTWFYRIVVNAALARLPKVEHEPLEEQVWTAIVEEADKDPEALVLQREQQRLLETAIQQLPPELRVVFILREAEGLRYVEIAEILGIPIGTVESRLFRARSLLRQWLSLWEKEGRKQAP